MTNPLELVRPRDWRAQLESACSIRLSAYVLSSVTEQALEDAARRGAQVHVYLSADCTGARTAVLEALNRNALARLRAAGAQADEVPDTLMHLKAAQIDDALYLDDRNWTVGDAFILRDRDPGDVAAMAKLFAAGMQGAAAAPRVALDKAGAISAEAAVLNSDPAGRLDVESENLAPCSLTKLLAEDAVRQPVRLLLSRDAYEESAQMQLEARHLQSCGVEVRLCASRHKMALAGGRAWIGSANASPAAPGTLDWGSEVTRPEDIARVRGRFERAWSRSAPLPPAATH